ncbi:glycosyltransferase, partial [Comamonadaceae bacterium OH2310_COT-174]
MPITRLADHLHKKSEYLIGEDVELHFCSETCLLREVDHRSRIVRTGQTDATALTVIRDNNHLFVPIAGVQRPSEHVLGTQSNCHGARNNWEKLLDHKYPSLMPVYRVCDCMAEVQIIDGEAFEDAATTPAWKKVLDIVGKAHGSKSKNHPITFDQWRSWMSELAGGLHQLEQMGLGHGDPYPFNAISNDAGAIWVDFGHLTDDPVQPFKDAWAFVLFTLLHTLGKSKTYSPAMLHELAEALAHAEQPGRFQSIQKILSAPYSDIESFNDARIPSLVFAEAIAEKFPKAFSNPNLVKLLLKAATQYFSDFLHHIHRGNQYLIGFHLERQRHQFVEQETLKLTLPMAEHQRQVASLSHAVAERDGRLASLNHALFERDEQLAKINKLIAERDGQILGLNQVLTERDAQLANINYVLAERDGQLANLNHTLTERDGQLVNLNALIIERDGQLTKLNELVAERDGQLDSLDELLLKRGEQLTDFQQMLAERNEQLKDHKTLLAQRDEQLASLHQKLAERDGQLGEHQELLAQRDEQLASLHQMVAEREGQLVSLDLIVAERDEQLLDLNQLVAERERLISELNRVIADHGAQMQHLSETSKLHYEQFTSVIASRSWRITRPARIVARFIKYRGLTDSDRGKLYNYAKRVYQRLPISYKNKLALKKLFLRVTGWTPAVGNYSVNSSHSASTLKINPPVIVDRNTSHTPELISKIGLPRLRRADGRAPYFGVRRREGHRRVAILTNQLLDWHDTRPRFGGGERYALELARLLKELSFDVTFYQPSFQAPGEGEYYGFKVILLRPADSIGEFHHGLCTEFTELTKDFDHVYYHLPEYASGKVREDGLMTCHGIWFDHNNYPDSIFRTPEWFQQLYLAFSSPRCVVSVDTNSIGVIRSLWPELASNMRFIPNFYDATAYHPRPELRNEKRLTILFPRRSQINRGSRIFGEIVSLIPHDVEIIWLGEGDPTDTEIVKNVCAADHRANFAVADFDQMPQWYQKADIAVIPTIACEGTSLSCLEALAAGCAVVSTNVGGLPDLVYDGMNGLLVDPDARSIAAAINRLIVDSQLRQHLQISASKTAHQFELKRWRERWVGVLHEYGWISKKAIESWQANHGNLRLAEAQHSEKWLILTRNAIHGGVESLIREEAKGLNAPVVVCGGHDQKDTCPFKYTRADDPKTLASVISGYDVILYHWLPDWCLDVLRHSGKRCIEFVHRTDTAESDKTVPTALVAHSAFLARFIHDTTGRSCRVVDHPIAIDWFKPQSQRGKFVGAITSYYETKGIDIFLHAWA